ncbi:MAG TPA: oxidoreductase [Solibacterales bacterium]|nr:oxidoreductase [Bryobacterales bacterium]
MITRREFAGAGLLIVPRSVLGGAGQVAPSDRVTLAAVGMGRQGMAVGMDLLLRPNVQMVAVCDCNRASKDYVEYGKNSMLRQARETLGSGFESWAEDLASPGDALLTQQFKTSLGFGGREPAKRLVEAYYGQAKRSGNYRGCNAYADFRELLEKESGVDAVYVATPDHWHAPIAIAAMRKRKHVLCQKPMTHSIGEAHRMAAVAREMKVATSVTVNNPSIPESKTIAQWIAGGAIGRVREVHNWSTRPFWPQGVGRPKETPPVPEGFDWNMWVGPAAERPYHPSYQPFSWRGWVDFGCGSFGDMGCYSFAGLFKILNLTPPVSVEATSSESWPETYPKASLVHLTFKDGMRLSWYDGGLKPPRPAGLSEADERQFARGQEGVMYVGDKGLILAGFNGDNPRLIPANGRFEPPPRRDPRDRTDPAIDQWLAACKGGPQPVACFETQAPVTEALLLGCLSQRMPGEKLLWDSAARKVTNNAAANAHVDPPYRGDWAR